MEVDEPVDLEKSVHRMMNNPEGWPNYLDFVHKNLDDTVDEKKVLDKTKDYLRSLLDISSKTKDSELEKQDPFDISVNFYNSIKDFENLSIQEKISRSIKYTVSQTKNAKVQSEFVEREIQEFSIRDKAREAEMMEMKKQLRDNTRQMHAVKTVVNKSLSDLSRLERITDNKFDADEHFEALSGRLDSYRDELNKLKMIMNRVEDAVDCEPTENRGIIAKAEENRKLITDIQQKLKSMDTEIR
ncbi:hypothetical protein QAD02_002451 [Eretmocerus hayati]|uniref:Uncharacterized protein n=1 Tax=Eretmocerus hayati TaxID=131215 RepID=A0ACC2NJF0_9HYME|nr:hypothetical protein QAD02_002451 [Eretmocerus hayati]